MRIRMVRFWIGLLITAATATAQPTPSIASGNSTTGWYWFGPKTVFPGFNAWFYFPTPRWKVPVTCSATGNRCDTSGSGYTPTGTETYVFLTATTAPTGMDIVGEGAPAAYNICNVSGTTFQLCQGSGSTVETFSSTGSGVALLLQISQHLYITSFSGYPSGTTVNWWAQFQVFGHIGPSPNGNLYSYNSTVQPALELSIPSNAATGDYTLSVTTCDHDDAGGVCNTGAGHKSETVTWTITVTAITPIPDSSEPSSFPAIPGLSTWSSYQTSGSTSATVSCGTSTSTGGGLDWCNNATGAVQPSNLMNCIGLDDSISYYDGGLTYHSIAVYQHDPSWNKCADNILEQVGFGNANSGGASYYVGANGQVPGNREFPIGYEVAGADDARFFAVEQYLAGYNGTANSGTPLAGQGCTANDFGIRECAYAMDLWLSLERQGMTSAAVLGSYGSSASYATIAAKESGAADMLIGHLLSYRDGVGRFASEQYFFDGLAMDSLIHWWQKTHDIRVPYVVKLTLDSYWSNYNTSAHIPMWTPQPGLPWCLASPVWYTSNDDHCGDNTTSYITQLANLFAHGFAWYWRLTGNTTYLTEGDTVFQYAMVNGADKGKVFNQFYRYSFNYVFWRSGGSPEKSVQ